MTKKEFCVKIAFGRGGLYDIFDIFRGPPCSPNKKFGISCHDHFDEMPDLSTVKFDGTILPKTMMDCRPVSPSGKLVFMEQILLKWWTLKAPPANPRD